MLRTALTLFLVLAACGLSLTAQTPSADAVPPPADLNQLMLKGLLATELPENLLNAARG